MSLFYACPPTKRENHCHSVFFPGKCTFGAIFIKFVVDRKNLGPHFLCWFSGVGPFKTWLISSWEENKLSKCTKWHLFHSKWSKLSFSVKIVIILSLAQLVTTVTVFSAWDKSRVKWDSQNSTQKMRTQDLSYSRRYILPIS